jgi:hypothetical protein
LFDHPFFAPISDICRHVKPQAGYESDHRMSILDVNAFRLRKERSRWPQMAAKMQIHLFLMLKGALWNLCCKE